MDFPSNVKYTEDHEWIRLEKDGTATIGITDFAQSELGDIVYVEVDTVEDELEKGDAFGTVEAVKTTSELYMPVFGKVLEFNNALEDQPEMVNSDPYGAGWIVKVKLNDAKAIEGLMDAGAYKELVG